MEKAKGSDRSPDHPAYWLSWADHVDPEPITLAQLEEWFQAQYALGNQLEDRF